MLNDFNVAFYIEGGRPSLEDEEFKVIFSELAKVSGVDKTVILTTYYRQDFAKYDLVNELRDTITSLKNIGYSVALLGDVPYFQSKPSACVDRKVPLRKEYSGCYISIAELNTQIELYDLSLRSLAEETDIEFFSLNTELLCDHKSCEMIKDNVLLYRDSSHLNIFGSRLIGGDFASRILDYGLLR